MEGIMIKIYYEEVEEYADDVSQKFKVNREAVREMLSDYSDYNEGKFDWDDDLVEYNQMLDEEIRDCAIAYGMTEKEVRDIVNYCDLTDTLAESRKTAILKGWT